MGTEVAVVTKLPPKKTAPNNAEKKKKNNKKAPPKKKGPPKKNAPPKTDQYGQDFQAVLMRLEKLEKLNEEKDEMINQLQKAEQEKDELILQLQKVELLTHREVERLTDIVWLGFQSLDTDDWTGFPKEIQKFMHLPLRQCLMEPAFGYLSSPPYE